jgi:hypothetical protein
MKLFRNPHVTVLDVSVNIDAPCPALFLWIARTPAGAIRGVMVSAGRA